MGLQSLKATMAEIAVRTPVPDRFFCPKCRYLLRWDSDEFRAWARETAREHLLSELLGCRCRQVEEEQRRRDAQRRMDANLPRRRDEIGPRTFENFTRVPGSEECLSAAADLAAGKGPPIVVMVGLTGSGKSHLIEAAVRAALDGGQSVRYEVAEDILLQLRHTFDSTEDGDISEVLRWYQDFGMLAIDDLGMHRATPWGIGYLTSIVDQRYMDGARLIVTTNVSGPDEMAERWGDRLASRLFDVRTGTVRVVWSEAPDYRLAKREEGSK